MQTEKKTKLILDTDIGDDIDDAYALGLAVRSPDCELVGVTTVYKDTSIRARLALKLLHVLGRDDVPVAAGRKTGEGGGNQAPWAADFDGRQPIAMSAVDFILEKCKASPGEITLCTIGGLTNLADVLEREPKFGGYVKNVVMMAGMIENEAGKDLPKPEWNVRCDTPASKKVYSGGLNPVAVGLDVTLAMTVPPQYLELLKSSTDPLARALEALRPLWNTERAPTLHDPLALAHALGYNFFDLEARCLEVDDEGRTLTVKGAPNAYAALRPRADAFMRYYFRTTLGDAKCSLS